MSTLYRKYRPQTFADVYGQEHIKQTIQNEIQQDKAAHAYLFCGPRGVGKTTMARLLAKTVNCINRKDGEFEPCNTCDSCLEIVENKSLDVVEIDAASHTGVDHVREHIINAARFTPNTRKYKVFIIDEVHMLSTAAFNALLKILEEPPSYVKFVLATTEIHKILPTIISRCQRFDFKKISSDHLRKRLQFLVNSESKKLDDSVYNVIIKNADGCLRDAESLLGQVLILDKQHITLEQVELILPITNYSRVDDLITILVQKDIKQAITLINQLVQDGVNLEQFTRDFVEYVRKIMLFAVHQEFKEFAYDLDEGLQEQIQQWSQQISINDLVRMMDLGIKALHEIKNAVIIQLPLELLIVSLLDGQGNVNQVYKSPTINKKTEKQEKISQHVDESKPVIREAQKEAPKDDNVIHSQDKPGNENQITKNIEYSENADISLPKILNDWGIIKQKIKENHYTLSCLLSAAVPKDVNNGCLILACKHKFSVDKIKDVTNRSILEEVISDIYQGAITIDVVHDASISSNLDNNMNITMSEVMSRTHDTSSSNKSNSLQNKQGVDNDNSMQSNDNIDAVLDLFGAGS